MSSFSLGQEPAEKLAEKVFSAKNFAILTSLGLHAIILGSFYPTFSNAPSTEPLDPLTDVGLVELTPLEESRLLDFEAQQAPSAYAPTPPLPETTAIPPAIPSLDSFTPYNYPTTPSLPSLPPLPPSAPVYAPPIPSFAPQPQPYGYNPQPNYPLPPLRQLPPPPRFQPNPQVLPPQRPRFVDPEESLSLDDLRRAPQRASQDLQNQQRQENLEATRPPETRTDEPTFAEIQELRRRRLLAENLERSQSLVPDTRNTSNSEAQKNYIDWLNQVKNAQPEYLSLTGTYPRLACARQLQGTAEYGIVVNAQGGVSNPQLIKSSGYPILNSQALRDLSSRSFSNSTGQPKPYRVSINYQPSPAVCPTTPEVESPPTNTRVNPPVAPVTPPPKPVAPSTPAQPPAQPQTVKPEAPEVEPSPLIPEPVPTPAPENVTPPAPEAPPVSQQPEVVNPEIEPPAPPSSKKPELPVNPETPNPEN